jgi:ectoine hydroxylase-related dioxygenase (phytanoyl-CoA dioxygenase family)
MLQKTYAADTPALRQRFDDDGFVFVKDVFTAQALQDFEESVLALACKFLAEAGLSAPSGDPVATLRLLENSAPESFFKLCAHAGWSLAGWSLSCSPALRKALEQVVGEDSRALFPRQVAVFYNERSTTRLQTAFHQERSYYPMASHVVNLWFPLFHDIPEENGPMIVLKGSHKRHYPYKIVARPKSITQLRVDDADIAPFERVPCALKRGDAVIFHDLCVHSTGENRLERPRISGVVRFFLPLKEKVFEPHFRPGYAEEETRKAMADNAVGSE